MGIFPKTTGEKPYSLKKPYFCTVMRYCFAAISALICATICAQPQATETLQGDISYYEETTYNLWSLRLNSPDAGSAEQTVQQIKRPESVTCHRFDTHGRETVITRYVQRDANVGSIGRDDDGNINFIANEISRSTPDTRTLMTYDDHGNLLTRTTWSFNMGDSTLISSGTDSIGTYRYDSDRFLVRYTDPDGMTVRYYYNERGHLTRQSSEWKDGGVLNIIFEDFEYDDFGNWTRCVRKVKDPGEPPRSVKIVERSYSYR